MIKKILSICFLVVVFCSCMNTNSGGIGLSHSPDKPPTPPSELEQNSQRIIDTYKSTLGLPAEGFTKKIEYPDARELKSGETCFYTITETNILKIREPKIVVEVSYQQKPDEDNATKKCPAKMDDYNDHMKTYEFSEYANSKVAIFLGYSDVATILQSNPKFKSAKVLTMQSTTMHLMDALLVRVILTNTENEQFLLETTFSKMNSFVEVIDQKYQSMKTNKVISYRKLLMN